MDPTVSQKISAGTLCTVNIVDEAEIPAITPYSAPVKFPLWPKFLAASFHVFVIFSTGAVIGLLVHTLSGYSRTRGINFNGANHSWPADLDLHPSVLFLVVASISLVASSAGSLITLLHLRSPRFSSAELASIIISLALLFLWLAVDLVEGHSEQTPKRSLLSWACRRESSPTNVLVRYGSICAEQVCLFVRFCCFF